jgi:serine/threonine protein kinase
VLVGKYRVDRVLGSGGMGMVVAAKHVELHELVAIKFLKAGISNADLVARFEREARAAAKIKGDHVARVIDLGRLENGSPSTKRSISSPRRARRSPKRTGWESSTGI